MGFTNGYARWTLFVATSLIAYVGIYLNKIPNVAKWHIHVGFAFAVIGIVITWLLTTSLTVKNVNVEGKFMRRLIEYDFNFDFTHLAFILELCYTLGVYLTFVFIYHKKAFHTLTAIFVSFEAVVMGNLVTWGHGYDTTYNNGYTTNERFKSLLNKVTKDDKSFYRIYSSIDDDWSVNNAMMNNYSSAGYFHSLYNFEVNNFTLWTGLRVATKDVGGIYRGKYQDLDNLLGVKYYFLSKAKTKYYSIEANNPNGYIGNVPFDFVESTKYDKEKSEYIVYENSLLNDFGYSYSSFYSGNMYYSAYSVDSILNSILLSKHARVSEDVPPFSVIMFVRICCVLTL